ncbi:MAG TPA: chloride channel protein [Polyangiaceae bacterium]|nr:chloride channel protein [Polyangiaceae bacterium]
MRDGAASDYSTASSEARQLFLLTILVGCLCGLVAVAFQATIHLLERLLIERALHAEGSTWIFWTLLTPTLGGLLAGVAMTWLVPNARGSGIPQVKHALVAADGQVRFRDAVGKFLVGSMQIGSGASLGREGPLVQICAGTATLLGRLTALPAHRLKRLTPIGIAAGMAASFNAPIAAVTFTLEEIVGALDKTLLSGVIVAAALAAVVGRAILGEQPIVALDAIHGLSHPASLLSCAVLGLIAALISVAFTRGLLATRGYFQRWRALPSWMHPAVGGLATGALAAAALYHFGAMGVTGGGREALGDLVNGGYTFRVLAMLCAMKAIATLLSFSSGGAGGIFTPTLVIGALLGGAVGRVDGVVLGSLSTPAETFALVGMGALFAGVIRAPITSVLLVFELTGNYGLVLPLMIANTTALMLARKLSPLGIYDALLAQDRRPLRDDRVLNGN